jgi:hypothetical protein
MPQRHQQRRRGLRWTAGAVGGAVMAATAGIAILAAGPADAAGATTEAQLSLSGVATKGNVLGGTTVGIHPGDTVDFKAAVVPTAGLTNVPIVGNIVNNLLGLLSNPLFQVQVTYGSNFPGVASRTVKLGGPTSGACKGATHQAVTFPTAGTYNFRWTVAYVAPGLLGLGCNSQSPNSTQLNQLKALGVAVNATNGWAGAIVVASNPPPPGISVQLPGVGVGPSLPGVKVPPINLPTINVPTIPVTVPGVPSVPGVPGLPGGGGGSPAPGGGPTSGGGVHYTPPPITVPEQVMGGIHGGSTGTGTGSNDGLGGTGTGTGSATQLGTGGQAPAANPADPQPGSSPAKTKMSTKRIDLASNKAPAAQLPLPLAIIAIIALSLVTASYARLYLLRRNV